MENNINLNDKILNAFCNWDESDQNFNFYHYTTMSGMKGIFRKYISKINMNSKKDFIVNECSLRASNVRYLNDSMEYKEGISTLKNAIGSLNPSELDENIYNISFCRNGNLLSQWDRYGKSSGIAIEFDFKNIDIGFVRQMLRGKEEKIAPCRWHYCPKKVEYENQMDLYQKVKKRLSSEISGDDINEIINAVFVPFCKNIGFKQEEESRIILYAPPIVNFIYDIDYIVNEDKGTVKPSINVNLCNTDTNKNIVKSLTVGPGVNQNLIFNTLVHIFDRQNYHFYDDDMISEWKEDNTTTSDISDKKMNYYFGKEDGNPLLKKMNKKAKSLRTTMDLLCELLDNNNSINNNHKMAINVAISILENEYKKTISEELKKNSIDNFIIHRCENGIIIKKSLIPYRG